MVASPTAIFEYRFHSIKKNLNSIHILHQMTVAGHMFFMFFTDSDKGDVPDIRSFPNRS